MEAYLPDIWLFLIAFFLLYYAVADGFDLGVGIISLFSRDDNERSLLMATLSGIWHDNQTWLVLLGGMLFGAFPLFYSLVLSSLYVPILLMLFGLVFRGVSFEFRENSVTHRHFWGISFGLGSLLIAVAQGLALGGLLGGLDIIGERFTGRVLGFFHPYSLLVTVGVVCGYMMLGANFLIMKTDGTVQRKSFRAAWRVSFLTLVISVAVHIWTVRNQPHLVERLTTFPGNTLIPLFVGLTIISFFMYFRALYRRSEVAPFLWNIAVILFSFVGLSAGMYPYMIPNVISSPVTVQEAAASPETLWFMLIVTLVLLPVILVYTAYKHRVFKGKIRESDYLPQDA